MAHHQTLDILYFILGKRIRKDACGLSSMCVRSFILFISGRIAPRRERDGEREVGSGGPGGGFLEKESGKESLRGSPLALRVVPL